MKYKAGYKYQLAEPFVTKVNIYPNQHIGLDFIVLGTDGTLMINKGYAWDGCSGPTWDDKTNMRAGLVHDALFQLMRSKMLDLGWRRTADDEFKRICKEDGMSSIRAWLYWRAVRTFGEKCAEWQDDIILEAP